MALSDIKLFLLDMDGTFYIEDEIIDGSLDFIKRLEDTGKDFMFVTNNSSHNPKFYVQRLKKMGLSVTEDKILTSGYAAAVAGKKLFPGKKAYVFGNSYLREELFELGIEHTNENPSYIIMGYHTELTYKELCELTGFINKGLFLLATHPDINCPAKPYFVPDMGSLLALVKASTGKEYDLCTGKPYKGIIDAAVNRSGVKKEQIAMVGDRLATDIKTGSVNNITSVLVLSGETNLKMLEESDIKPDYVFDNLKHMAQHI